jgi:rhodanese-related sulfurtransferase
MKSGESCESNDIAERIRQDFDRQIFYLKTSSDTLRDLIGLEDTVQIMERFLLTANGSLGIVQSFLIVFNAESAPGKVVARGLSADATANLQDRLSEIVQLYCPSSFLEEGSPRIEDRIIERKIAGELPFCPEQTQLLIQWTLNKECFGLLGVGEKLIAAEYDQEEKQFLLGLINSLKASLYHAGSMAAQRQLQSTLQDKYLNMDEVLNQAEISHQKLEKQVFQLNILYDTVNELSGMTDSGKILESFLLMTMGAFSVEQGYILLFDRKEKTGQLVCRGLNREKLESLPQRDMEKTVNLLLEVAGDRLLRPANQLVITDRRLLDASGYPMEAKIGILFSIHEACLGFLCLGRKITEKDYPQEEHDLLIKLVKNLIVSLEKAGSYEDLQKLNLDLEKRNLELARAWKQLDASRLAIEVLERAKANIRSTIQKEMMRARRVAGIDFLLIFGVALVVSIIFNLSNPTGLSLIPPTWSATPAPRIDIFGAKLKYDTGTALFIDARPQDFFNKGHVKGAINLSLPLFDFMYVMIFEQIDPQREIIVYGRSFSRLYDDEVGFKLLARGHTNVKVLSGGLSAWEKEHYPMEP